MMFSSFVRKIPINTSSQTLPWKVFVCRHYAKPLVRRPLKVFTADGKELTGPPGGEAGRPRLGRPSPQQYEADTSYKEWEAEILGDMRYVKLGDSDKRFRRLYMASTSRKVREKKRVVVLEGRRLVTDAIQAGARVRGLYFSAIEHLRGMDLSDLDGFLFKVNHKQLSYVSGVTTPPGIMALCEMPTSNSLKIDQSQLCPITLICDNIRDPGNMGTLLRSAAAVGCHKILVTTGNVDIWDPKVVRAGAGCHFRTWIRHNLEWPALRGLLSDDCSLHLAENQQTKSDTNTTPSESSDHDQRDSSDSESDDDTPFNENMNQQSKLPLVSAFNANFQNAKENVLVVGGETYGLSREARHLAKLKGGQRIYLPMVEGLDSLNSAMAGTVLMYEIKRQTTTSNH